MRALSIAIALAALTAMGQSAAAATPTSPYDVAATRTCLVSSYVALVPGPARVPYPEVVGELAFKISGGGKEFIVFARDPARAIQLRERLRQVSLAAGVPTNEVRTGLVRAGNVVFYPSMFTRTTVNLNGTIRGCLR